MSINPNFTETVTFKIIKCLSIGQRFDCRKLSKKFKKLIDEQTYDELILITRQFYNGDWYRTNSAILRRSTLKIANLNQCLQNDLIRKKFKNIKRLKIYNVPSFDDFLEFEHLNFFEELKHLEINNLNLKSNSKLNLDKLELLFINLVSSVGILKHILSIDAAKLRIFHTYNLLNSYRFEHPQSLESIISLGWNNNVNWVSFVNLNELISFDLTSFQANYLISLNKLKRLQFFKDDDTYKELKVKKKYLNRISLRIQYLGIDCDELATSTAQLNQIPYSKRDSLNPLTLEFYLNNCQKASNSIYFINEFNYGEIRNALEQKRRFREVLEFTSKLVDIKKIKLEGQFRGSRFILNKFLKGFKNLNSLVFDQFSPNIIDRLPNHLPNLKHLDICNQSNNRRHLCNTLMSFKNLISIVINVHVSSKHIDLIFKSNQYLQIFNMIIDPAYHVIIQRFWPLKNVRVITCRFSEEPSEVRALRPEEVENLKKLDDANAFVSCVNYANLKLLLKSFSFRMI